jgi:hypothetical protein
VGDLVWLAVVLVVAAAIGLAWRLLRRGPTTPSTADIPDPAGAERAAAATDTSSPAAASDPAPPVAAGATARVHAPPESPPPAAGPVPASKPRAVPAPPRLAPTRPPQASSATPSPLPASAAPRVAERPVLPALPKVARFELRWQGRSAVLLERAAASAWQGGAGLASTPVQRELLSGLLARASELDGSAAAEPVYAVHIAAGIALPLARCDRDDPDAPEALPAQAFDVAAAADFAAAALALQAARTALPDLRVQVGEAKAVTATLHPKWIVATEGRVKTLMQDLARYLREAEENYAGAIRKQVFIGRVDAAFEQAAAVCEAAHAAAATARAQIDVQARAARFGEVQLERSLAALRELHGQRRVLDAAARILSGWGQLRLLLGEAAPAAAGQVDEAAAALGAAADADLHLAARLRASIDAAKPPDYVGKAEFIAQRTAARELLAGFDAGSFAPAGAALARAQAALAAGFGAGAAQTLLLRLDDGGRVAEVRLPATEPAAG